MLSLAGTNPLEAAEPKEPEVDDGLEVAASAAATASAIVGCRAEITEPTIAASFCLLWNWILQYLTKHIELNYHLGAETAAVLEGMEGEGPKSWGAALTVERIPVAARTTEASIFLPRIFQDSGQPANCAWNSKSP